MAHVHAASLAGRALPGRPAPPRGLRRTTLPALIRELDARYPGMWDRLCEPGPRLRLHINAFVDGQPATLESSVTADSVVHIIPAVSGGSGRAYDQRIRLAATVPRRHVRSRGDGRMVAAADATPSSHLEPGRRSGRPSEASTLETVREWHAWLEEHHRRREGVWLVQWKPRTGKPAIPYEEAIEEALCFGWVDSTYRSLDDERGMLWWSPRRKGSLWARTNKERVARLEAEGRMTDAGRAAIDQARADGSWTILESVEDLVVPDDLAVGARTPDRVLARPGRPSRPPPSALTCCGSSRPSVPRPAASAWRARRTSSRRASAWSPATIDDEAAAMPQSAKRTLDRLT